ncbi:hypothetical protein EON73_02680 [bacterium]|nr:MAG: hypothetical protein EON73_02680 [bacterium]
MKQKLLKPLIIMTLGLFFFLLLTVFIPFGKYISTNANQLSRRQVKIIAHRGASGHAPENTLASFQKAIEIGVDMIELDVHLSADDSIIVMHDYKLSRTTNGTGEIADHSYDDLKKLDAGSKFSLAFKGEKIPTLSEVLELVKGRCKVLIELKWPSNGTYAGLVEKVDETIRKHHAESWTILQSFETSYLQEAERIAPNIERQELLFGQATLLPLYFNRSLHFGKFIPERGVSSINIFYIYLNKKLVKKYHKDSQSVYVFTLNNTKDMIKAISMGADGLITNFPELAKKVLAEHR